MPDTKVLIDSQVRRQGQHVSAEERRALQARFLELMEETGYVTHSSKALGLHESTIAYWKRTDPEFAEAYANARLVADERLRDELEDARKNGLIEVRQELTKDGDIVELTNRKQDARVLMGAAAARLPEYRPAQKVELSGPGGGPVQTMSLNEAQGVLRLVAGARELGLLPDAEDGDFTSLPAPAVGQEAAE